MSTPAARAAGPAGTAVRPGARRAGREAVLAEVVHRFVAERGRAHVAVAAVTAARLDRRVERVPRERHVGRGVPPVHPDVEAPGRHTARHDGQRRDADPDAIPVGDVGEARLIAAGRGLDALDGTLTRSMPKEMTSSTDPTKTTGLESDRISAFCSTYV